MLRERISQCAEGKDQLEMFFKNYDFNKIVQYFSNLGFNCTSLDLEGLISGKLNR